MSKVKTVVVFGHYTVGDTPGNIFETARFGKGMYYETAYDFINSIIVLHKRNSDSWVITNVVIG